MNHVYEFLSGILPIWMLTAEGALGCLVVVIVAALLIYFVYRRFFGNQTIKENSPLLKGLLSSTIKRLQDHQITPTVIKKMYEIFEAKKIPAEEYDQYLYLFVERFENLRKSLNTPESEDPIINKLKERSWQALEKGQFEKAEALLNKAYNRDLAASKELHELPKSRLLSSATVLTQLGNLQTLKLNYIAAAEDHELAAQRIPEGDLYEQFRIQCLNHSGIAYLNAHAFDRAEKPLIQALQLRDDTLPPQDPELAEITTLFAKTFVDTDAETAERLYKRALVMEEFHSAGEGQIDPEYTVTLTQLANLYVKQKSFDKAEVLYKEALKIRKQIYGEHHEEVAASLTDLAELYHLMEDYDACESYHLKSIVVREAAQGSDHPDLAFNLINLGLLYQETKQYKKAGPLYRRAIKIQESALGPRHPDLAIGLHNLGSLLQEIGKYDKSAELFKKELSITKKTYGRFHPDVAQGLTDLASLYATMKRFDEAEQYFKQAISIWEKIKGKDDIQTANAYQAYAVMLFDAEKQNEAEKFEAKANKVLSTQFSV